MARTGQRLFAELTNPAGYVACGGACSPVCPIHPTHRTAVTPVTLVTPTSIVLVFRRTLSTIDQNPERSV